MGDKSIVKSRDAAAAGQDRVSAPASVRWRSHRESTWRRANLFLGVLISGVFLYLAVRGVELNQVWNRLYFASAVPLLFAVCVGMLSNLVRAVRWKSILRSHPGLSLRHLFASMMIGYLANNVLPARMGELVRIYILERKAGVSKSTSAATVVLERVTDTLVLLILGALTAVFLPLPGAFQTGSRVALGLFAAFAVALLLLAFRGKNLLQSATSMVGKLSPVFREKVQGISERFIDGLSVLHSGKEALFILGLTLGVWAIEAMSVALVITSLGVSLPWIASLFLVLVLSLSFIIPAAPGGVGTYEFFGVMALTPFGLDHTQAVGVALVLHAVVYLTSTTLGLVCLWAESLNFRELAVQAPKEVKV